MRNGRIHECGERVRQSGTPSLLTSGQSRISVSGSSFSVGANSYNQSVCVSCATSLEVAVGEMSLRLEGAWL